MAVLSQLAVIINLESGEKLAHSTLSVCPSNVFNNYPVLASHNLAYLSQLAVQINFPSDEKFADLMNQL